MSKKLEGKICCVTGATKGIGRGIAVQLEAAGATLYITGRTESKLDECSAEITARGGTPIPVAVDHTNDKDVEELFEKIKVKKKMFPDKLIELSFKSILEINKTLTNSI